MLLSIVIPTDGRRPHLLAAAIDSCLAQAVAAPARAEIIVVDNTPDGALRGAIAARGSPCLRWVHAPEPGVAQARNAGVRAARGEFVAFLDDDEAAGPHWAAALLRHAQRGAVAVFGAIEPTFEAPPPDDCAEAATRLYSRAFPEPDGADITHLHAYLGTGNSLFAKACFDGDKPFAEELSGLGGEDSALIHALVRRGVRLTWAADARVNEHVPRQRVSYEALATRHFRNGQIRALVRWRAGGLARLQSLAWMALGASQAAIFAAAALTLAALESKRTAKFGLKAWGGAGKVLWQRPFWAITYGATVNSCSAVNPAGVEQAEPPMPEEPFVSIIVVNYRTRDMTLECLRSVLRETREVRFEIVLVDNASGDGLVEAAAKAFPGIRLLPLAENIGFARANTLAAEHARGNYLLLLNPDTVVLDRAIDRLVAFARARPRAKIWGGRTLYSDGSLNPTSCWRRMTLWNVLCRTAGLAALFPGSAVFNAEAYGGWDRATVREVDIVTGCFLLIETAFWRRLGGFDPTFFMYGEEADLCLRAAALGARPAVTPAATIIHHGGASQQAECDKTMRLLAAKAELIRRHWRWPTRRLGLALFALWPLTRAIATGLAARAPGGARHGARADTWRRVWQDRARWRLGYR